MEGQQISRWFLRPHTQAEVGEEAHDAGAAQLRAFFQEQLDLFDVADLDETGHRIIECFRCDGTVRGYHSLMPGEM